MYTIWNRGSSYFLNFPYKVLKRCFVEHWYSVKALQVFCKKIIIYKYNVDLLKVYLPNVYIVCVLHKKFS